MGEHVVCPVCDSTDYVLRQGLYYCRMCNTQSQELGTETVMDDETIPADMVNRSSVKITVKQKKSVKRKSSLLDGVRWSTAEGFSWILRGWLDQLKLIGVDVEVAVIQLWTLYLRKLKLGFEKKGEEGRIDPENLRFREQWNLIGGPPGLYSAKNISCAKKRRLTPDVKAIEEEFGENESIEEKKARRKKRRHFFNSFSHGDSASGNDGQSSYAPSVSGDMTSESETDTALERSEAEFCIDINFLSYIFEKFTRRQTSMCQSMKAQLNMSAITMKSLAALLSLAVIARPFNTLTIPDLVRMFNTEQLKYRSAFVLLPLSYNPQAADLISCKGREIFSSDALAKYIFRIASIIHQPTVQVHLPLTYTKSSKYLDQKTEGTFQIILSRFLRDLCLPSELSDQIIRAFERIDVTKVSATVEPYPYPMVSSNKSWETAMFPLISKRALALVLIALKFHCVLDDHYEVYMSHNLRNVSKYTEQNDIEYFDMVSWIRLSKLRLDKLMAVNHHIRQQYQSISHIGTPELHVAALMTKFREENERMGSLGDLRMQMPDKKMKDLAKLMATLSIKVKPYDHNKISTEPLLESSNLILDSKATKQNVKNSIRRLLSLSSSSVKAYLVPSADDLKKLLVHEGASNDDSDIVNILPPENWSTITNVINKRHLKSVRGKIKHPFPTLMLSRFVEKKQLLETLSSGKCKYSKSRVPCAKKSLSPLYWVKNKTYWFAHYYPAEQHFKDNDLTPGMMLNLLPSNFAWILKYFSSYLHLEPSSLLCEMNELEKLILLLDPEYFGVPQKVTTYRRIKSVNSTTYKKIKSIKNY